MRRVFYVLCVVLLCGLNVHAQEAQLSGLITDPTGAVVPQTSVALRNQDTGVKYQTESNGAGLYTFSFVKPGLYEVTVSKTGFKTVNRTNIKLDVSQNARVDITLEVGQTTQEVTVAGNVVEVETEKASISDVVTGSQIANLNLNTRNFASLYTLVPGASPANSFMNLKMGPGGSVNVSFNGNRMNFSNLEIDGGNDTDEGSGGNAINATPALDSIAEFRITTNSYSAETGKHSGALVEVLTKSGTREFHGSAYEFLRNDHSDANDWFVNREIAPPGGNAPRRPLKWNTYGYTLGGPFYVPGHYNTAKTKTFFFWSESWAKYREGTVISTGVPTTRMRQGDFSECNPASPNYNMVVASGCTLPVDPNTGTAFASDVVPIDPNAQVLMNSLVPPPNSGADGYVAAPTTPTDWRQEQLRVDQNLSNKTTLFVRYTQDTWTQTAVPSLWTGSSYDTTRSLWDIPAKSIVLHATHTFTPTLMNEFLMSYSSDALGIYAQVGPASPAHSITKPSNWSANNLFPPNARNPLLPAIGVCGGTPFCFYQDAGFAPWHNSGDIGDLKDNVAFMVGKHSVKAGVYVRRDPKYEQVAADTQGVFQFTGSGPITTGNALADMYLGRIQRYNESTMTVDGVPVGGNAKGHWRMWNVEPYIQDDLKVTPRLTVNLGVRYYYMTPFADNSRPTIDSVFVPNLYNPEFEALLDSNGNLYKDPATGHVQDYTTHGNGLLECGVGLAPKGCTQLTHGTVAPRFGFAFDPTGAGKTSIRGGYGVFFETGSANESFSGSGEGNPPVTLNPAGFNLLSYKSIVPGPIGPTNVVTIPSKHLWGNVQQISFGIQHEFPGNNLLSANYVGTLGRHIARSRNLNQLPIGIGAVNVPALAGTTGCDAVGNCDVQSILINTLQPNIFFVPYRGYGTVMMDENSGILNYNALQVNLRHTVGHGLIFQGAYTYSHSIDNSTATYFMTGVDDNSDLSRWRGSSDLNRTHVLVMNYVYELPFASRASNPLMKSVFGGWRVSGITSFFSGQPVNFGCGRTGYGSGIGGSVMCNSLGPVKIKKGVTNDPEYGPTPTWFDPSVIGQPTLAQLPADGQPGMFGYMGRNVLTGPGRNNWDIALLKDFQTPWFGKEHSTLQFRWETYNTFNHPQWQAITAGCGGNTAFGEPCSGLQDNRFNGQVSSAWDPRIMQFALKLTF